MQRLRHLSIAFALLAVCVNAPGAPEPKDKKEKDSKEKEAAGKSLERLIRESRSADPAVRDSAAAAMGHFGSNGKAAIPQMVRLLEDPDPSVAASALSSLRVICSEREITKEIKVPMLTHMLKSGTTNGKIQAAMALGSMGSEAKSSVRSLSDFTILSSSWEVRKAGAYALGRVAVEKEGGPSTTVVNSLCKLVRDDPSSQVRLQAMQALATLGAHRSVQEREYHTVKHALDNAISNIGKRNGDSAELIWAHTLLSQTIGVKATTHVAQVEGMLRSRDPNVRASAVTAVGVMLSLPRKVLDEELTKPVADGLFKKLLLALEDRDDNVGNAAGAALAMAKENLPGLDLRAIALLMQNPMKPSYVRVHATHAIGMMGDRAAKYVKTLIAGLSDNDLDVAAASAQSLGILGRAKEKLLLPADYEAIVDILKAKDATRQARAHAAGCLGLIGEHAEPYLPALIATLSDADDLVAAAAAQSIVALKFGLKEADVATIAGLLSSKQAVIRARGVQILGALDERAKPHLADIIKLLDDKDPRVVMNVIAVLAQLGQSMENIDTVETALKTVSNHSDKDVQLTATQALGVLTKFRQAFAKP